MEKPSDPDISRAAALLADRSRVAMLLALAGGSALPAGELARAAAIGAPAASAHLAKLVGAGILAAVRQGRHRYFRLASPQLPELMEALAVLAAQAPSGALRASRVPGELRFARTCYGHLAGVLGVATARALCDRGILTGLEEGCAVTAEGQRWLERVGLVRCPAQVRLCPVDWSERRPHLSGVLGSALARHLMDARCLLPVRGSRALRLTDRGRRWFRENLALELPGAGAAGARDGAGTTAG